MSTCSATPEPALQTFDWHPAELISRQPEHAAAGQGETAGFALIVLNQPLHSHRNLVRLLWDNACVRIAADGGANCLYQAAGQHGDACFDDLRVIIGDLDSLTPETRAYYESGRGGRKTQVIHDPDQESTDFGKAVAYTRQHCQQQQDTAGARTGKRPLDIVAVGGLGGRVDQGLSQLHHLYLFQTHPRYADGRMYLFSGESLTFLLKSGRHRIRVRDGTQGEGRDVFGKHVGIIPVGRPSTITTCGLEWDVTDWETRFGGRMSTSNHVLPDTEVVQVETTAEVLFTIALRQA